MSEFDANIEYFKRVSEPSCVNYVDRMRKGFMEALSLEARSVIVEKVRKYFWALSVSLGIK